MAIRVYIMPAELKGGILHPKYLYIDGSGIQGKFECKRFGNDLLRLVFIDISSADHAILSAYPDVVAFPANLSNTVPTAQVANVKAQLAAINIPYKWVNDTLTWKQVIKKLINHSESMKRLHNKAVQVFSGYTLATKLIDLDQALKDKIQLFITGHNLTLNITAQTDIEDLLNQLADTIPVQHKIYGEAY